LLDVAMSERKAAIRASAMTPIRAVVGEDDPLYLAGIVSVLEQATVQVVARAANLEDLLRKARAHRPDLAVLDIEVPPGLRSEDCVKAVTALRAIDPRMSMLVLAPEPDERCAVAILGDRPEGVGLLAKSGIRDVEDFTSSVHRVARGGTAIDPQVAARLAGRRPSRDPLDELTAREREVLSLIATGLSNRLIAAELVVTLAAIERHITSIFSKLELRRDGDHHPRVLAALRYLGAGAHGGSPARAPDLEEDIELTLDPGVG
jgi:DNA-binding NarL/FixJ family response regulator